jgi:hypothetical protein
MQFPYDPSDGFLYKVAIGNFIMLCIAQFFVSSFLGDAIYDRCKKLGYEMKSSKYLTWFNVSGLWREAQEFNEEQKDEELAEYIRYHKYFIRYGIASFLFVVFASEFLK